MSCKLKKLYLLPCTYNNSNLPAASQQTILPQDLSDQIMMEAPDSPPETQNSSADPSFSSQAPSGSQQNNQQANTSRSNGDSAAKVNHGAPGSTWYTKKFYDEFERASNSLQDQNWDHGMFFIFAPADGRHGRLMHRQRDMVTLLFQNRMRKR
jgi:hypothetical protein